MRIVGALVVLAAVAWLALPPLVRRVAETQGTQALGRAVHLGAVHFNPLTLTLAIDDLSVAGPTPAAPPALQLRRVDVDAEWRSIWRRAPVLREVVVSDPVLRVARTGDGHYDFDDVLARLAKRPPSPPDAEPVHFALYNVQLRGGRAEFDDRPVGRRHVVQDLALDLPFLSDLPDDVEIHVTPRLQFTLDGTRYESRAEATPFRRDRAGTLALRSGDIALAPWLPYWPASLGWRPTQGRVTVDASLAFDAVPGQVPHWSLTGRLGVDELAVVDTHGEPLVAWRALAVDADGVRPLERQASVKQVTLDGLDVALARDAHGVVNVVRAFAGEAPASAAMRASAASPAKAASPASAASGPASGARGAATAGADTGWQVRLLRLELTGGHVRWRDAAVAPATQADLDDLRLRVDDARWPLPPGPGPMPLVASSATASSPGAGASSAVVPASARATPASAATAASGTASGAVSGVRLAAAGTPSATAPGDAVRVHLQARWRAAPVAAATAGPAAPAAAASATTSAARAPSASASASASAAAPAASPTSSTSPTFVVDALVGARRSRADVTVDQLAIAPLRPWFAAAWRPPTEGVLSANARIALEGPPGGEALPRVEDARIELRDLRMHDPQGTHPPGTSRAAVAPVAATRVAVDGLGLDLATREVEVQSVTLAQPSLQLARDGAGHLGLMSWFAPPPRGPQPTAHASAVPASAAAPSAPGRAWRAHVARVAIDDGRVQWRDAPAGGPVAIDVDALQLAVSDVRWPAAPRALAGVKLSARVKPGDPAAGRTPGRLSFDGRLGLDPVSWQGQLRVERLPVHTLDAYLADASPVQLLHADLGWRGPVQGALGDAGLTLRVRGDALVTDLHGRARHASTPVAAGEDLVSWQSLAAQGVDARLAPGQPPVVAVGDVTLAKAYARLVVTEQGRFNLTDLAPPAGASAPAGGTGTAASTPAPAASPASSASAPSGPAAPLPDIRVASVQWTDARIEYTDRFVKPNYQADLGNLTGKLGAFSTRSPDLAPLEATGRIAGTGLLDIRGQVNPLSKPPAMDLTARASDIELAPLSPYAGKYAGYAIERGKLSMNLHYQIQPDGRLQASNQVILNQLTFGERVDSPDATKLPVLFAVALLKDRNGVIDIDLPIGGSINDPDFSVGRIVVKLIVNLLTKAVTAPFSIFSGGGKDLSQVLFVPGTARLQPDADAALDKVAKALQDRPALKLTITGLADEDQEHAAMQAAELERRLVGLRRTELLQAGESEVPAAPALAPADRARLLKRLYEDTKLPDKPRNVIGLAKDVPPGEMEARLKAGLPLPADATRQLAVQRATTVRDALAARGLPNERLFVAAPKIHGAGSAEPEAWLPHAQLELSMK